MGYNKSSRRYRHSLLCRFGSNSFQVHTPLDPVRFVIYAPILEADQLQHNKLFYQVIEMILNVFVLVVSSM